MNRATAGLLVSLAAVLSLAGSGGPQPAPAAPAPASVLSDRWLARVDSCRCGDRPDVPPRIGD